MTASPQLLLVATGAMHGTGPAMVYSATDHLVALDPATGAQRWSVGIGPDGQGVPAVIAGGVVVIAEADATVIGLDAMTGKQLWKTPAPSGCAADPGGLDPDAALVPVEESATVSYFCRGVDHLVALDPATGAARWTWKMGRHGSVDYQSPTAAESGVLGLLVSGGADALAPVRSSLDVIAGGYETISLVAVDQKTGTPLWQLDRLPDSAGVYASAGKLCVVSAWGVECYDAHSGRLAWQQKAVVAPGGGGSMGPTFTGFVVQDGTLYQVVPTAAAAKIPDESTTYREKPGTFVLQARELASGRVVGSDPLPAFYGGHDQVVVSVGVPPAVFGVAGGRVLVSPQSRETDVIEAFAAG